MNWLTRDVTLPATQRQPRRRQRHPWCHVTREVQSPVMSPPRWRDITRDEKTKTKAACEGRQVERTLSPFVTLQLSFCSPHVASVFGWDTSRDSRHGFTPGFYIAVFFVFINTRYRRTGKYLTATSDTYTYTNISTPALSMEQEYLKHAQFKTQLDILSWRHRHPSHAATPLEAL